MSAGNPLRDLDALVAWDGAAAYPRDVTAGTTFGYLLEVKSAPTNDVTIGFVGYDAQTANPNAADLATAAAEQDAPLCWMVGSPIVAPSAAQVVIKAGTPAGTKIAVSLRNYTKKFSGLTVTGTAPTAAADIAKILATAVAFNLREGR